MVAVLLIEDDLALRMNLARTLAKLSGVSVVDVGSLTAALQSLDSRLPDVIVSDIDLPDRSGLELLGELGRRGLKVPVVYVSAYLKAYGAQIPPHALVEVLEKPVSIEDLRAAVLKHAPPDGDSRRGPSAAPPPFGVPDYVQLATMGSHSVRIDVTQGGALLGTVIVLAGQVWSARDDAGEGSGAFVRLAFCPDARVVCRTLQEDPGVRNVQEHWEGLLLDGARMRDEAMARRPKAGPRSATETAPDLLGGIWDDEPEVPASATKAAPEPPPAPTRPPEEIEFEEAWDAAVQALLIRDYSAACEAFERAARVKPDHPGVAANLARLRELGHAGHS